MLGYLNLKVLSHLVILRVKCVVNKVRALFYGSVFLEEYLLLMRLHYLYLGDSNVMINLVWFYCKHS